MKAYANLKSSVICNRALDVESQLSEAKEIIGEMPMKFYPIFKRANCFHITTIPSYINEIFKAR